MYAKSASALILISSSSRMSKLVTNFGDMVTTGNSTLQQNLTVQGAYSTFSGNLYAATSLASLGNASTRWGNLAFLIINTTTLNVTSIFGTAGLVGVNTTGPTASLHVAGNVYASNAVQTLNVFAANVNVTATNTLTLVATSNLGVGTVPVPGGATVQVQGNVWASNALTAPTVISTNVNTTTVNTVSIFGTSGLVGLNTSVPGASLHVIGNVYASNAFQTLNVYATNVNATSVNTLTLVATSNLGVGTVPVVGGPTLQIQGNLFASNALSATNLISTNINSTTLNTLTFVAVSNLGVGTVPVVGGPALQVQGNLFASNALSATNLISTNINSTTLNTLTFVAVSNLGVGTVPVVSGPTLQIQGNLFASNALSATNLISTNINSTTLNTLTFVAVSNLGVGTVPVVGGPTLQVQGNVWASNALSAPNVFANVNATVMNTLTFVATSNLGVGTAPVLGGPVLQVQGNVWASNALSAPNVSVTGANATVVNTVTFVATSNLGVGTAPVLGGASLQVQGNVWASNALSAPSVLVTGANATVVNTVTFVATSNLGVGTVPVVGGASLQVQGNVWASNALSAPNTFVTGANATVINTVTFVATSNLGVGTVPVVGGPTLQIQGNLYVSNALQTTNVFANVNATTVNTLTLVAYSNLGVGTAPVGGGATLQIGGNLWASNAVTAANVFATNVNVSSILNTVSLVAVSNMGIGTVPVVGGPALQIQGNLYASNALSAGNVVASNVNVTILNAFSVVVSSNLGIGTVPVSGGPTLVVQGNVWASNAISAGNVIAANVNVTTLNTVSIFGASGNVGIGTSTNLGASLQILGNLYVSNALVAQNVISTNVNVAVMNAQSIWASNLYVGNPNFGTNIYVGNAISSTNVIAVLANLTTINVGSIFGQANVGINTAPTGAALTVAGNAYFTNTFQWFTDISTGTMNYLENQFLRGPYLRPTTANASTIQGWISATCNASSQPARSWWATSPVPVFGNAAPSTSGYHGSVLVPDGRVVFGPGSSSNIGVFVPATNQFSSVQPSGDSVVGPYSALALGPSGNVVCIPGSASSNIGIFNPVSLAFTNVVPVGDVFSSGILDPNGNITLVPNTTSANLVSFSPTLGTYSNVIRIGADGTFVTGVGLTNGNVVCIPGTNANVVQFDPIAKTVSNSVNLGGSGTLKFVGAVLAPNGNIVCLPGDSGNVGVFKPPSTWSNVQTNASGFAGGALTVDGRIVFGPGTASNVGLFDPVTLTLSNLAASSSGYAGARFVPDGRVVFVPGTSANVAVMDTLVQAPYEFCLVPFLNSN
jgi:hypothetical protein